MAAPELFINSEEELSCNAMRELVRSAETNKAKGSQGLKGARLKLLHVGAVACYLGESWIY